LVVKQLEDWNEWWKNGVRKSDFGVMEFWGPENPSLQYSITPKPYASAQLEIDLIAVHDHR